MRETSASKPLITHRNLEATSKPEPCLCSGKSVAGTYLLAMWCPVYRRRDSHSGSRMELENLDDDAKGKGYIRAIMEHPPQDREFSLRSQWLADGVDQRETG